MLSPDYWIARTASPDKLLLTSQQIDALNQKTLATDPAMHDLTRLGSNLTRDQVISWVKEAWSPLTKPLVDAGGTTISAETLAAIEANVGIDRIPPTAPTRYGLSVRRAQLRTYPTSLRAFPSKDLTDFESFQAGTLFPADPVVIAHTSADAKWYLVVSDQGPAWVARSEIAEGAAEEVFLYGRKTPYLVITGDQVRTVYTPEAPTLSEVRLDMGARVPLAVLPANEPVNGQGPYEAWTIELPTREDDGSLRFRPVLVQKIRDASSGYLPLTRANIIRQSFKFLGERYGWGHLYNARDCSGFTSDVYRSMGIRMPPNSGAQGASPAFQHRLFAAADSHEARVQAVLNAAVGDLVVVPGHVLMILGKVDGQPYVIQDVPFAVFRDSQGRIHWTKVNEVSVTPLLPLLADEHQSYVDAMTSLVHVTAPALATVPK
jgi:cell wall-associated NlpC family hydrolase